MLSIFWMKNVKSKWASNQVHNTPGEFDLGYLYFDTQPSHGSSQNPE